MCVCIPFWHSAWLAAHFHTTRQGVWGFSTGLRPTKTPVEKREIILGRQKNVPANRFPSFTEAARSPYTDLFRITAYAVFDCRVFILHGSHSLECVDLSYFFLLGLYLIWPSSWCTEYNFDDSIQPRQAYQVRTAKSIKLNPAERTTHDSTRLVWNQLPFLKPVQCMWSSVIVVVV